MAIKPLASGCKETPEGLRNDDALLLQKTMSIQLPYSQVNPVALPLAVAPHIAAEQVGRKIILSQLIGFCHGVLTQPVDLAIIEGVGGWRVPLNHSETMAGLAKALNIPVILVVGIRLGCINHALLTEEIISSDGLALAGWVANILDPNMNCQRENVMTLRSLIRAPCLGEIPYLQNPTIDIVRKYLNFDLVIS